MADLTIPKAFFPLLLLVPVVGCSTPPPVKDAANLFGKEVTSYKVQLERFAKVSNAHRVRSSERLARIRTRTDYYQERVDAIRTVWGISDNKTALRVFNELRELGDRLEKDPSSGRRREILRATSLRQQFGKATVSTKQLDQVIKAAVKVSKRASTKDVVAAISPFVEAIGEAFEENGQKAADALENADAQSEIGTDK